MLASHSKLTLSKNLFAQTNVNLIVQYDGNEYGSNDFIVELISPDKQFGSETINGRKSEKGVQYTTMFTPQISGNYTTIITNLTDKEILLSVYFDRPSEDLIANAPSNTLKNADLSYLTFYSPFTYLGIALLILGVIMVKKQK